MLNEAKRAMQKRRQAKRWHVDQVLGERIWVCEASSALILLLDSLTQEHLRRAATATHESRFDANG